MKKKKKTNKTKSSSNQINGSDSSTFHVSIATTAVAQICHSVGYKATQTTALQTLTNITVRYLTSLATSAANSAVSTGRTECNLYDVIRGLEDVHADVGFKGNSAVTKRLIDSEMLKDMMRFVSWSREVPFAKPLVTSSCGKKVFFTAVNEGESVGEKKNGFYCGEKEVFTAVNEGESDGVNERKVVPRGKQMVTSLCENYKLNHVARKNYCGEKEVFTVVNEGEKEKVPRGRQMVTSLCENDKLNCVTNYGEKEVFTAVNEGESEGVKEKKVVPRDKQMVTSLCEYDKLNHVAWKNYCGEKEVFTAVNEGESEGVNEKKVVPRGKQMVTSLCENDELNHVARKNYCGENEVFTVVNEGEKEKKAVPRGRQMMTSAYGEMSHVPKWLPKFPRKIDCGEKVVFTEGKSESEKEKVNYYKGQEVSELPVVRKKVRFEIGGKSGRGKDVINLKFGVDLRSGVCKGGKRILCQIYDDGEKYVNGGGKVVKKSMVKMKSARRYIGD